MGVLEKFIPLNAIALVEEKLSECNVDVKVVAERRTKHGDYRKSLNGQHLITINRGKNKYRFLITLIHELAHFVAFRDFGDQIKPHGKEWKLVFTKMMLPFISPKVFPEELLRVVANHFRNPKASSDRDFELVMELRKYDDKKDKTVVFDLNLEDIFYLEDKRSFQVKKKRVKRIECMELKTKKIYLFPPHIEVNLE